MDGIRYAYLVVMAKQKPLSDLKPITVKPLVTGFVTVRQGDQLILIAPQQLRDVAMQIAANVHQMAS